MDQNNFNQKRILITGLISAKVDKEHLLQTYIQEVEAKGGIFVDAIIQRRGVSRSNKSGGVKIMNKPLNAKFILGSGKIQEIKEAVIDKNIELVYFINDLNTAQKERIEAAIDCPIFPGQN